MKKSLLFLIMFFVVSYSFSQVRVEYNEEAKILAEGGVFPTQADYPIISLPEYDYTALREKSQNQEQNIPFPIWKGL